MENKWSSASKYEKLNEEISFIHYNNASIDEKNNTKTGVKGEKKEVLLHQWTKFA